MSDYHDVYVHKYVYWTCPKCEHEHKIRLEMGEKVDCWFRECEKCGVECRLHHKRLQEQPYYYR